MNVNLYLRAMIKLFTCLYKLFTSTQKNKKNRLSPSTWLHLSQASLH